MVKNIAAVLLVLVSLTVALAACGSGESAPAASYTTLSVQQAFQQVDGNGKAVLVDVRTPQEWASQTGIPKGATLIEMDEILAVQRGAVNGLPTDQPIYVICNSGNRSRQVSDHLLKLGYKSVYNVDGGIQDWIRAGLPTEVYTP